MFKKNRVRFSLYVARRYLVSKKTYNIINIISLISILGVAVGTMALVVILSVFNGLNGLVQSLFDAFSPDLKISLVEGKTFCVSDSLFERVKDHEDIAYFVEVLEENALFAYDEKQKIGTIKGVSNDFLKMSGIDSMMVEGDFALKNNKQSYAVVGQGVAYYLSIGLNFITPLKVYVPRRTKNISINPRDAYKSNIIFPAGIFSIQPEFDSEYVIVPIEFARELLEYENHATAIELKIRDNASVDQVQDDIADILGTRFKVQSRFEQNEYLYKVMQSEKWAIYLILSFILVIASFNTITSLTMLIIDKRKDMGILLSLGASQRLIRRIFLIEGWLIALTGTILGLGTGAMLCLIQQKFGIIGFPGDGTFIVQSYPVEMQWFDFILVFITVLAIGWIAAWFPVRRITKKHIRLNV